MDTGPAELRYTETHGDPDDRAVVLLPGAGFTRRVWRPHAQRLADHDYYAVAVDKPAHGKNPETDFSIEKGVEQVAGIAQELNDPVVIGHSAGGYIALHAGEQVPEVTRVVSISGAYNFRKFPRGWLLSGLGGGIQFMLGPVRNRLPVSFQQGVKEELTSNQQYVEDAAGEHENGSQKATRSLTFSDTWPDDIPVPTRILYGGDEPFIIHGKRLADQYENAEFLKFDGGHLLSMTEPESVMPYVFEFIEE